MISNSRRLHMSGLAGVIGVLVALYSTSTAAFVFKAPAVHPRGLGGFGAGHGGAFGRLPSTPHHFDTLSSSVSPVSSRAGRGRLTATREPSVGKKPRITGGQDPVLVPSRSPSGGPPLPPGPRKVSRREALTGVLGGGLGIAAIVKSAQDMAARQARDPASSTFVWNDQVTNREATAELFSSIEGLYPLPFLTYLARFLLNFDPRCKAWWVSDVEAAVPSNYSKEQRQRLLLQRLAEFCSSVEVGLRAYLNSDLDSRTGSREDDGPYRLADLLKKRYEGKDGVEGRRAREQLAVLFSLLDPAHQPVPLLDELLASLPTASGTARIWSLQQLDKDATRVVLEQTLRGMGQDPLMMLPARHMLPSPIPIPTSPSDTTSTEAYPYDHYYHVPGLETLGQRKRLVVDVEVDPVSMFGTRAEVPVLKERSLTYGTYLLFALSGAVGCSLTHSLVIPIDVVKTRKQVLQGSKAEGGLIQGVKTLYRDEGLQGLVRGWEPTLLGYLYYGVTVYPGYEFFKRALLSSVGPAGALLYHAPLVILAGALATIIACLGVCPAEAVRIRMVARQQPFTSTLTQVAEEEGLSALYDGFPPLLVRQVLFGMAKFLVFDSFGSALLASFPQLNDHVASQLAVSLLSGLVAGLVAAIVSQPADTVLSKMNAAPPDSTDANLLGAVSSIWRAGGVGGLYAGLGSRCLWSGSIISGQFLLYDVFKNLLHVTASDLRLFMDVIPSIQ